MKCKQRILLGTLQKVSERRTNGRSPAIIAAFLFFFCDFFLPSSFVSTIDGLSEPVAGIIRRVLYRSLLRLEFMKESGI